MKDIDYLIQAIDALYPGDDKPDVNRLRRVLNRAAVLRLKDEAREEQQHRAIMDDLDN